MKNNQRHIPMEITDETIHDYGINSDDIKWMKLGGKWKRVILVPASEEQYLAYMRPLWRSDKQKMRHSDQDSLEYLLEEVPYKLPCVGGFESTILKEELISELHRALDVLEEKDRIIMLMFANGCSETKIGLEIGMSQKGVNKRKKKIIEQLREILKNFI